MTAAVAEANPVPMTPSAPTTDQLFALIERVHGDRPWGRLLDAGTGAHSLSWVMGLPTTGWTAVTGGEGGKDQLARRHADRVRPTDRLVVGDWAEPGLLAGEVYDVILADYLLGALDGFAPYFQDRLFARLSLHLKAGGWLYAVGLGPTPDHSVEPGGQLIIEINRLRDACILLAGHRCYREYPDDWVCRHLEAAGLIVEHSERVPIVFRARYVNGQLDVCRSKLPLIKDPTLRAALDGQIEALRSRALAHVDQSGGIRFGHDWVVAARKPAEP